MNIFLTPEEIVSKWGNDLVSSKEIINELMKEQDLLWSIVIKKRYDKNKTRDAALNTLNDEEKTLLDKLNGKCPSCVRPNEIAHQILYEIMPVNMYGYVRLNKGDDNDAIHWFVFNVTNTPIITYKEFKETRHKRWFDPERFDFTYCKNKSPGNRKYTVDLHCVGCDRFVEQKYVDVDVLSD